MEKKILDVTCGARSIWFNKHHPAAVYCDKRREQVEKVWRGEWEVDEFGHKCSKCGEYLPSGDDDIFPQFCPNCGDAKTDEAVDMVMEKINNMEEMTNEH